MTNADELIEPEAANLEILVDPEFKMLYSCAISLKRIADRVCSDASIEELVHKLGLVPMNRYGEGLVEGIQNAIARGKNGIQTYD